MKQRFIFTLLLLLAATTATAHDFEVDGIFYNIINGNEAAVTYKGSSSSNNTKGTWVMSQFPRQSLIKT